MEIDGAPWFVAADVCRVLGLQVANVSAHLKRLGDDEKRVIPNPELSLTGIKGQRAARLCAVSESGLYKLIMRSDKPEAKRFQDWVTRDVLPSIRKNGGYIAGQEKLDALHCDA
ncbi:BRO-N domain-containing protein [Azospirillum argentinense]|uniref:BRO-N domain-containing protein n=1 Tax=Azospirillum argentinense TaxID=2970906 RepID=UPI001B3C0491|nr:BRO family protein [Azospirillum argentinense]